MRHLVLKLDDIGRDSSRPVIDVVLWAMGNRLPISIGTIGVYLRTIPRELVELVQTAVRAGYLEIWNHGYRHIRYDQVELEIAVADLTDGHKAIFDIFGVEPAGFGFPFNRYTEEVAKVVREQYPWYFIYETDFHSFRLLSPEYNSFADGQPRQSCLIERIGAGGENIVLQAHPPRWSKFGFDEFASCVKHLVEVKGYVCVSGRDALDSTCDPSRAVSIQPSAVSKVVHGIRQLSERWTNSCGEYVPTLSNFKSYFLTRFNSDTQKNWHQVRAELFPYRPQTILDVGCGLGNWSLPFWLSGECKTLILNDVNPTIVKALNDGISCLQARDGISIHSGNMLPMAEKLDARVDFLVSANTFNYLDPVDFFRFAQASVIPGGRMLLMLQTPAFNRLRYRLAYRSKDRSVGAEVLVSDFSMLLRKAYGMYPDGFRHAYPAADVNRLANMFDFTLLSQFSPYGESKEDGENVYDCLFFKKTSNMRNAIVTNPEWMTECTETVGSIFGSKAFAFSGIPFSGSTRYFDYYGEWIFNAELPDEITHAIRVIKTAINGIRQNTAVDMAALEKVSRIQSSIGEFADKVRSFAVQCNY